VKTAATVMAPATRLNSKNWSRSTRIRADRTEGPQRPEHGQKDDHDVDRVRDEVAEPAVRQPDPDQEIDDEHDPDQVVEDLEAVRASGGAEIHSTCTAKITK
jgi:hypothetical protein